MKRQLLLLVAVASAAAVVLVPLAPGATRPDPVTIELDEIFTGSDPAVTGTFTASGGVFGTATTGEMESVSYKPGGVTFTSRDHFIVYTATDLYTTDAGSFSVSFEGKCAFAGFEDPIFTAACSGNWQVNGGTGSYTLLKGTGAFDEVQEIDVNTGVGDGFVTLIGRMHTD